MSNNIRPTQKAVPSSDIKDLRFNSGKIDEFVTSLEHEYKDRFGRCHMTIEGMRWIFEQLMERFKVDINQAIIAAGYIPMDSFQQGAEITKRNEILRDETTGEYYRWDGDLPKSVPAGSTPASTGGVGLGAWVSVSDTALRGDLSAPGGVDLVNGAAKQTDLDSLESSVSDLADAVAKGPSGSAFTRRLVYSTDGLNIYYHITKIPKGVGNINKEYANPPTFTGGIMYVVPESPTTVIRRQKHSPMISSSDAFQSANNGAGGFQPWGLQIANGVAYQDFTPVDSSHGRSALIIQRDGSVIPAEYTDGKTAQQYVDEGAWCSFGWHYMLVKNGVAYADVSSQTDISARAVFGVYPDGTYCLIHTQGQSTVFGMTCPQLQALCVAEGLLHAVALDGGGSAQLLKDNVYVHPSTDASPRALGTYACINVPVRSLDTGWLNLPLEASVVTSGTIQVRQIDDKILYKYNFNLTIAAANTVYTPALQASLSRYLYPYLGHTGNTYSTWLTPRSGGQMGTMSVFAQGESSAVVTVQTGTTTSTTFRGCATFESRYCAADFGGLG